MHSLSHTQRYGIFAWGWAPRTHLNKVCRSLKKVVRVMISKNKHESTKPLFEYSSILPFDINIKLQQGKFMKQLALDLHPESITKHFPFRCIDFINNANTVFPMWKSLQVLQKAHINIMACAIYTYLFFYYKYTLLFCWNIKKLMIAVFLSKLDLRPVLNDIHYKTILVWGLVSIGLTITAHCLWYAPS